MKTVGIDATALFRTHPTGVDRAARGWVEALARTRPQWRLALVGWNGTALESGSQLQAPNASCHHAPFSRAAYRIAELVRVPVPFDLRLPAVERWFFPDFVRLPLVHDHPSLTVVHDLSYLVPERFSARLHRRYLERQVKRAVRLSRIAVVSNTIATEFADHFGIRRSAVEVLPLAVDSARFYPRDEATQLRVRQSLGLDRPYVLSVGALHARKNLRRLIDAYASLGEIGRDLDLILVGPTNSHSSEVLSAIQNYRGAGRVRHVGYVPEEDLSAVYSGAKFAVVPSVYEGFGLPVLEAMACGVAVLASAGGALQEVGGSAALYAEARDVTSIAEGLRSLASEPNLRRDLGFAGVERAAGYSWDRSGEILAQLLEDG